MQRTRIQRGGPIAMSPPVANKFGSSDGEKPGPMAGGRRGKR
jgi:hypothetical protein